MCGGSQIKPVVNNADALLKLSKKVLGSTIVNGVVKRTFFRHFCAGEARLHYIALALLQVGQLCMPIPHIAVLGKRWPLGVLPHFRAVASGLTRRREYTCS